MCHIKEIKNIQAQKAVFVCLINYFAYNFNYIPKTVEKIK